MKKQYVHCIKVTDNDVVTDMVFETWEECREEYKKLPDRVIAVYYTKERIENAKSGVDSCLKCGNPKIMYWCGDCEDRNETGGKCCEGEMQVDKDYHLECN